MPGWKTGETIFGHSLNSRLYLRLLSGSELGFGIDWLRRNYKAWSKLAVKRYQGERLTAGHRVGWTAGRARSFQSKIATMKTITRRDLFVAIPAFAATGAGATRAFGAQAHASEFPMPQSGQPMSRTVAADDRPGPVAGADAGTLGVARAIAFDQMAVRRVANGGESRDIAHGTLATGETVNMHQSMQVVGSAPNPAHVIQHTEFILVREGELEFQHEVAGQMVSERVGPGGVIYLAFGTRHAVKNVGGVPARYFVVAIGGDAQ